MVSCIAPTDDQKSEIVNQYLAQSGLFECTVVLLKEPTYQDTSRFISQKFYVLARDVYGAQRLFDDQFSDQLGTLNGAETYWVEIPISGIASYPYSE